ncbi:hypothetical protein BDU57DRAFT_503042, partial [Ampelomyces quisqualis]
RVLDSRAQYLDFSSSSTNKKHKTHHKPTQWFSQLTFSTLPRPPRPTSTSSRPSCLPPAPSSWTSSAPAASPSPLSSRTQTQSSSARAARRSFASQLVARPVLLRAALSEGSRRFENGIGGDLTGYDNDYHGTGL